MRPTSAQETGTRLVDGRYELHIELREPDHGWTLSRQVWALSVDTDEEGQALLDAYERAHEAAMRELFGPFASEEPLEAE